MMTWIGVDVGGPRKAFDVAIIDATRLMGLHQRLSCCEVVQVVEDVQPLVVAIDSPRSCAPADATSRDCERTLNKRICGIRWTPYEAAVRANDYYRWIEEGLELYAALAASAAQVIEVFPTASWTRWLGKRGSQRRSVWTRRGLAELALAGLPVRTNQDQRDAVAAAVTARQHTRGATECIGEIVVPVDRL